MFTPWTLYTYIYVDIYLLYIWLYIVWNDQFLYIIIFYYIPKNFTTVYYYIRGASACIPIICTIITKLVKVVALAIMSKLNLNIFWWIGTVVGLICISAVLWRSLLRSWWNRLSTIGLQYGYHHNASKTFLVVKDEYEDEAKAMFGDTYISVTTCGKRHLGAAVGSRDFATEYVSRKVEEWCEELMSLA